VAALGRAVLDGLARAGVAGTIKHMPGHGRAMDTAQGNADRHRQRGRAGDDLAPFRALADAPIGMTGHLRSPPGTRKTRPRQSPFVISEIIRGRIGFDGLLLTDDLDMEALSGTCRNAPRRDRGGLRHRAQLLGEDGRHDRHRQRLPAMSAEPRSGWTARWRDPAPPAHTAQAELIAKRDALLALAEASA
jgi:beta-N-acetylhexosaminidase